MADIIEFPSKEQPPMVVQLEIICHSADHIELSIGNLDTDNDHEMLNLAGVMEYLVDYLYCKYGGKEEE